MSCRKTLYSLPEDVWHLSDVNVDVMNPLFASYCWLLKCTARSSATYHSKLCSCVWQVTSTLSDRATPSPSLLNGEIVSLKDLSSYLSFWNSELKYNKFSGWNPESWLSSLVFYPFIFFFLSQASSLGYNYFLNCVGSLGKIIKVMIYKVSCGYQTQQLWTVQRSLTRDLWLMLWEYSTQDFFWTLYWGDHRNEQLVGSGA